MRAHIPDPYAAGRETGRREAMVFYLLALRNLYGFGRHRLAAVCREVQRISDEAANDTDWHFRIKRYFEGLGVRLH